MDTVLVFNRTNSVLKFLVLTLVTLTCLFFIYFAWVFGVVAAIEAGVEYSAYFFDFVRPFEGVSPVVGPVFPLLFA